MSIVVASVRNAVKVHSVHPVPLDQVFYCCGVSAGIPRAIHYGLQYNVDSWAFNKYSYLNFDPHKCTPWDLDTEKPQAGIFPPPPGPANLTGVSC